MTPLPTPKTVSMVIKRSLKDSVKVLGLLGIPWGASPAWLGVLLSTVGFLRYSNLTGDMSSRPVPAPKRQEPSISEASFIVPIGLAMILLIGAIGYDAWERIVPTAHDMWS